MSLLIAIKLVIVVSVILNASALAMRARPDQVFYLIRRPGAALRALVSMYIVVPAVALIAIWLVNPRPGVVLALLVLSLSPVPPLLPKKQLKWGGEGAYILGLLVFAALASLLMMPIGLPLLGMLFERDVPVSTAAIAKALAITIAVPMILGFTVQKLFAGHAERISHIVAVVGSLMLVIGALVALVELGPALWRLVGEGTLIAMLVVIIAGLGAGYVLGGPSQSGRTALALASATRHPGVAMGVIGSSFPDAKLAVLVVIAFVLLNVVVGIPFVMMNRHQADADAVKEPDDGVGRG